MPYTPTNWVDGVTLVGAVNLNKLEQGVAAIAGVPADVVVTPGSALLIRNRFSAGDTQPAFKLQADGRMDWGPGGSTAPDTALYRVGANALYTGGALTVAGQMAPGTIYLGAGSVGAPQVIVRASGDGNNRFTLNNQGQMAWGDGTAAVDTTLYRGAAGFLQTDGSFTAGLTFTSKRGDGSSGFVYNPATAVGIGLYHVVGVEAQPRFYIGAAGSLVWGAGGSTGADTNLYRSAANVLATDDQFQCVGLVTTGTMSGLLTAGAALLTGAAPGDTNYRLVLGMDGGMNFGPGNAAADVTFNRSAPGVLSVSGQLAVGAAGIKFSNGSIQTVADTGTGAPGYGTSLPGSPVDGQEYILVDSTTAPTYAWRFRYNASSSSTYKWEFIGGAAKQVIIATNEGVTGSTFVDPATVGPTFTLPRAGDYEIEIQAAWYCNGGTYASGMSYADAVAASLSRWVGGVGAGTSSNQRGWGYGKFRSLAQAASQVITVKYRCHDGGSNTTNFMDRQLRVTPVRVS